jgi:hypothetical protein
MQEQELINKSFDDISWTLLNASGDKLKKRTLSCSYCCFKRELIEKNGA